MSRPSVYASAWTPSAAAAASPPRWIRTSPRSRSNHGSRRSRTARESGSPAPRDWTRTAAPSGIGDARSPDAWRRSSSFSGQWHGPDDEPHAHARWTTLGGAGASGARGPADAVTASAIRSAWRSSGSEGAPTASFACSRKYPARSATPVRPPGTTDSAAVRHSAPARDGGLPATGETGLRAAGAATAAQRLAAAGAFINVGPSALDAADERPRSARAPHHG